ncbi:MAG: hypothetical protein RL026_1384 [Pseudomonadota bacterium]|jgi:predicted acetyltransferase
MSLPDISLRDARESPADQAWIATAFADYVMELAHGDTPGLPDRHVVADWLRDRNTRLMCITLGRQPAGFALLVGQRCDKAGTARYQLSDFYVARSCRRRGIGRRAARLLMDRFAGDWEVRQPARLGSAVAFWRAVIRQYTAGVFEERLVDGEFRQRFRSGARDPARA